MEPAICFLGCGHVTKLHSRVLLQLIFQFDLSRACNLLILFGLIYVLDRLVQEWVKTFIRVEDQSKYAIPMQFHVLGKGNLIL